MSNALSPSRLATYLTCPRQFEYDYEHGLQREQTRDTDRYINRGKVLDTALQQVADTVTPESGIDRIQTLTAEAFDDIWPDTTQRADYPSSGAYEYDRRVSRAAVMDYLNPDTDGDGIRHLQYSAGTEVHIEWDDDDWGPLHGYADNIVSGEDQLLVIDYKASGSSLPNKSGSDLERQLAGENHYPRRLKKWLQILTYSVGLQQHDLYTEGDTIKFMFYALIGSRDRTVTADGYTVEVSGNPWDMTDLFRSYRDELETLLETAVSGVRAGEYEPQAQDWELIQEHACEECDYRAACGDYIAEEVRFS